MKDAVKTEECWLGVSERERERERLEAVGEQGLHPDMPSKQSLNSTPHKKDEWVGGYGRGRLMDILLCPTHMTHVMLWNLLENSFKTPSFCQIHTTLHSCSIC